MLLMHFCSSPNVHLEPNTLYSKPHRKFGLASGRGRSSGAEDTSCQCLPTVSGAAGLLQVPAQMKPLRVGQPRFAHRVFLQPPSRSQQTTSLSESDSVRRRIRPSPKLGAVSF